MPDRTDNKIRIFPADIQRIIRCSGVFLAAVLFVLSVPGRGRTQQDEGVNVRKGASGEGAKQTDREGAAERRIKARNLLQRGRYREALDILEKLCREYPRNVAAARMLADVYIRIGKAEEAVSFIEKKLEERKFDVSLIKSLGEAYMEMGREEKAGNTWRSLLAAGDKNIAYYDDVAALLWKAGMYDDAVSVMRDGAVGRYYTSRMIKVVEWERILGRSEAAFKDEVKRLSGERAIRDLRGAETILEIFRESGRDSTLLPLYDDLTGGLGKDSAYLHYVKVLFLVESGRYKKAREVLRAGNKDKRGENLYYSFISAAARMDHKMGDIDYELFLLEVTRRFLEHYRESPQAPRVTLLRAELKFFRARRRWPYNIEILKEAFDAAAGVKNPSYKGEARLLMAQIQLEGMGRPAKALDILGRSKWRQKKHERKAKITRARALSISGCKGKITEELEALASGSDSTVASEAAYRLSEQKFYCGKYSEALEGFSKTAEEYYSSNHANDALDMAMLIRREIDEDEGALDLFAAARLFAGRNELMKAIDSLRMLKRRFPESPLIPRALLTRASLEIDSGMRGEAEADLTEIAEDYPMSSTAPAALEKLADLISSERPREALKHYGISIERYPDNPFISRIRKKYSDLSGRLKLN
ncbi:MAG: tetratricopeptide repeat protein [Candidatus Krumholzibacteriota bacterium]|nr:tetratricopeptide repeat protein [Candidatus Krumholzibacteriota bacterium]